MISHNRQIIEIINPKFLDINDSYMKDFAGMTVNPVKLKELETVRIDLLAGIWKILDSQDEKFLINFIEGNPNWSYFPEHHIKDMPAVKWKQYNLDQIKSDKRSMMVNELKKLFSERKLSQLKK